MWGASGFPVAGGRVRVMSMRANRVGVGALGRENSQDHTYQQSAIPTAIPTFSILFTTFSKRGAGSSWYISIEVAMPGVSNLARMSTAFLCLSNSNYGQILPLDYSAIFSHDFLRLYCDCNRREFAARRESERFIRCEWRTKLERTQVWSAMAGLESHPQEVVCDTSGRTGEVRDLACKPGVH